MESVISNRNALKSVTEDYEPVRFAFKMIIRTKCQDLRVRVSLNHFCDKRPLVSLFSCFVEIGHDNIPRNHLNLMCVITIPYETRRIHVIEQTFVERRKSL